MKKLSRTLIDIILLLGSLLIAVDIYHGMTDGYFIAKWATITMWSISALEAALKILQRHRK